VARLALFVSVALYGGVWFVEGHAGASANAMMPVFAWTAVLFGVSVGRLLRWAEEQSSARGVVVVLAAAAAQLLALTYNPGAFVPPARAVAASEAFVAKLRAMPGDVYVVDHSYDEMLAGKAPHAEGEALGAVLDAPKNPRTDAVRAELAKALAERPYTAVVVDNVRPHGAYAGFDRAYPLAVSTGLSSLRYMTSQAQWFLLRCDAPESVKAGLMDRETVVVEGDCLLK
jgi:hypothetical protein